MYAENNIQPIFVGNILCRQRTHEHNSAPEKKFPLVLIAPLMWTLQESDHLKYLTTISFLEDERYQERKFFHMHNQTGIKLAASPTFLSLIKFLGE